MTLERWVDLSKWQGDVPSQSLRAMRSDGITGICVGAWHGIDRNPFVRSVLKRARAVGLKTALYIIINNRPGAWTVDQAKAAAGDEWGPCVFHSADVELQGVTEAILQDALDRIVELGGYPNIYTGAWFWNMWRPSNRFASVGLWTANYNGRPDLNVPLYGGWTKAIGHQFTGSTPKYGTTVDQNVFDSDWLDLAARRGRAPSPAPEPEPPAPPPDEEEEIMGKIADMAAAFGRELEAEIAKAMKLPLPIKGDTGATGKTGATGATGPAAGTTAGRTYTVRSGDSLSAIADKYEGVSWRQIYDANKALIGPDPGLIQPGQVLVIP